jgi:hypothetical protein
MIPNYPIVRKIKYFQVVQCHTQKISFFLGDLLQNMNSIIITFLLITAYIILNKSGDKIIWFMSWTTHAVHLWRITYFEANLSKEGKGSNASWLIFEFSVKKFRIITPKKSFELPNALSKKNCFRVILVFFISVS